MIAEPPSNLEEAWRVWMWFAGTTMSVEALVEPGAEARVERARSAVLAIPVHLGLLLLGCGGITLGLLWDISWHSTIGRDTFWTPAHLAIYLGSLLCGACAGHLAWRATFRKTSALEASTVGIGRWRAPLGALVMFWGMGTMLTAAGFDNWWHEAYGLDVGILTPAHSLLSTGMVAVHVGVLMLIASSRNRSEAGGQRRLDDLLIVMTGLTLMLATILLMEFNYPNLQHGATFFKVSCAAYPVWLVMIRRASERRYAATWTAMIYTALTLAMLWVLPLFEARPLLAPIFNPVEHMWPGLFPLLLIVPALGIDHLLPRLERLGTWGSALILGAVFAMVFVVIQWQCSEFLLSPEARNAIFGADQWYFAITHTQEGIGHERLGAWRYQFWDATKNPLNPLAGVWILGLAILSCRFGLAWGAWMGRLQR